MYLGGRWNAVNIGIALSTRPRIINPLVSAGSTAGLSICTRQARKNRSIIEAMVDRGLLANLENMSEGGGEEDLSAGGERGFKDVVDGVVALSPARLAGCGIS